MWDDTYLTHATKNLNQICQFVKKFLPTRCNGSILHNDRYMSKVNRLPMICNTHIALWEGSSIQINLRWIKPGSTNW